MGKDLSFPEKSSPRICRERNNLPYVCQRGVLDHPERGPMAFFARWCEHDVWEDLHQHFADDPDLENGLLDSTVVRAHPCAAGASKKTADKQNKLWAAVGAGLAPKSM
jgi:hypothetical protein